MKFYILHFYVFISVISFLTVSCRNSTEADLKEESSLEEQQLEEFINEYYETLSSRNWEEYRKFFWPKATIATIWQEANDPAPKVLINSIEEFILQTPQGPDSFPIFEENLKEIEFIKVKKGLAEIWATYEAKFGTKDNLMEWTGTDLFSLMKHNGEWRISSMAFESD